MGRSIALVCLLVASVLEVATAQTLPDDQLQVDLNGYFDSFQVNVIYPTISLTKAVGPTTSLTGGYLIDAVTAASIRSASPRVDVITSASGRTRYENTVHFDEVRHQVTGGVTQLLPRGTLSVNGIYGIESDYSSGTTTALMSLPFAKNNTVFQAGFVRSWNWVFPKTKPWTRTLDVTTWSGGVTQVLSKRFIVQLDGSLILNRGYQADAYTTVPVYGATGIALFEPVHPDTRDRRALGIRANYSLGKRTALQLGYRYYWDDWDVRSHTVSARISQRSRSGVMVGTGVRLYAQSKAFFFEPIYFEPQEFMTVDSKLDKALSAEFEVEATWAGIIDRNSDLITRFDLYIRQTDSPNWFSRSRTLVAGILGVGFRFRF